MGSKLRRVTCQGSFFGTSPQEVRKQLDSFQSATSTAANLLILPGYPPFVATLESVSIRCESDGKILPYTMIFVEEESF